MTNTAKRPQLFRILPLAACCHCAYFQLSLGQDWGAGGRRFQGESEKVRKERRLLPWTRAIWINRNATCSEMRWKELSQGKDRSEKNWTTACGGGWLREKRYNEKPNRTYCAEAKIDLQTKNVFSDSSAEKSGKLHVRRKQQIFRFGDRNIFHEFETEGRTFRNWD